MIIDHQIPLHPQDSLEHPENIIIDNLAHFEEDFNSQTEKWSGPVQSGPVGMGI